MRCRCKSEFLILRSMDLSMSLNCSPLRYLLPPSGCRSCLEKLLAFPASTGARSELLLYPIDARESDMVGYAH